jgi:hypothetical protein
VFWVALKLVRHFGLLEDRYIDLAD